MELIDALWKNSNPHELPRLLATIPRWSTVPVIRRQTNGEHIFLVARYCLLIVATHEFEVDIGELLTRALHHDDEEVINGDIPSPAKGAKSLPTNIYDCIVKVADRMEAVAYMQDEMLMGNQFIGQLHEAANHRLHEAITHMMSIHKAMKSLKTEPKINDHPC